jgi:hypothetical protein
MFHVTRDPRSPHKSLGHRSLCLHHHLFSLPKMGSVESADWPESNDVAASVGCVLSGLFGGPGVGDAEVGDAASQVFQSPELPRAASTLSDADTPLARAGLKRPCGRIDNIMQDSQSKSPRREFDPAKLATASRVFEAWVAAMGNCRWIQRISGVHVPMSKAPGQRGAPSCSLAALTSGGQAAAFVCRDDCSLAVAKVYHALRNNTVDAPDERLRGEGEAMDRLRHPGLVRRVPAMADTARSLWTQWFPMTLFEIVDHNHGLAPNVPAVDTVQILRQVLLGIRHMHSCGFIHHDVKLENVFVHWSGGACLGDMGLVSRTAVGETCDCSSGSLGYTPPEMAPAQRRVCEDHGHAVDIWGFGVCAMSCAMSRNPFNHHTHALSNRAVQQFVHAKQPVFYSEIRQRAQRNPVLSWDDAMPERFSEVAHECLTDDPDLRPTARECLKMKLFARQACQ